MYGNCLCSFVADLRHFASSSTGLLVTLDDEGACTPLLTPFCIMYISKSIIKSSPVIIKQFDVSLNYCEKILSVVYTGSLLWAQNMTSPVVGVFTMDPDKGLAEAPFVSLASETIDHVDSSEWRGKFMEHARKQTF